MLKRLSRTSKVALGFLGAFVLLSLADFLMTLRLIHSGDGDVLESNPVAEYWYAGHGWAGMAGFKLAMVVLVGGLAAGISLVRLRTGELVLVFACGAQAAIVLNSVFLDRFVVDNRGPAHNIQSARIMPETPGFVHLTMYSVQRELGLSERQIEGIMKQLDQRRTMTTRFGHVGDREWNTKIYELAEKETAWLDSLSPRQSERLQQIIWQMQRLDAFSEADVIRALALSEDQQQTIQDILEAPDLAKRGEPFRGQRPGFESPREVYPEPLADILAVLTPHQRALWDAMIGPAFVQDAMESVAAQ